MKCREFEDNLSEYFADIDTGFCREAVVAEKWFKIPCRDDHQQALIAHASQCSDCTDSLLKYLEIRGKVDYHVFPCFHLAYYATVEDARCIENDHGFFSIMLDRFSGVGIGFCPWCGTKLITSRE